MVKIKEWRQGLGITQKALADAAGDIDIQNVTVKRFSLLMKGISELSRQVSCPCSMKSDIETVNEIHEMVDRLFKEDSA